jgi:hypothetical protein
MNNIKIFRPLRRVSIENAIELTYEGMDFVSTYIPLNLVKLLKTHIIDEIEAINRMNKSFDEMFFPKKEEFRRIFKKFIETKITKEFNQFYLNLLKKADYKSKVLKIIGFHRYEKIFRNRAFLKDFKTQNLKRDSLQQLRYDLKKFVSQKLIKLIKSDRYEEIEISELKKFPEFHKWTAKVIYEHKKNLTQCEIRFANDELIDVSALANNYYGKIILNEAKIKPIEKEGSDNNEVIYLIPKEDIEKINEIFSFLNLKDPIVLS